LKTLRFVCVALIVFAMGGGLAHVFALPNKINFTAEDYLVAQRIYRGWNLLAIPLFGGLASTITLAISLYMRKERYRSAAAAVLFLIFSLVLFFTVTFPTNQQTNNWTVLPPNWESLRNQWEYSHALNAILMAGAFTCLMVSILGGRKPIADL